MNTKLATVALVSAVAAVDRTPIETTNYVFNGIRGVHEGFNKAFYKDSELANDECLNDETINNMITYGTILSDPKHMFSRIADAQYDFNIFADGAQIMENLGKCRFEGPAFDVIHMCAADISSCSIGSLGENLTKNMFVLVGKITSMAETFKGFPKADNAGFREEMMEVGDDIGTFFRVVFNFSKP